MGGGSIVGGRYELVRKIAEGGMGSVWEARHTLSKKVVALKILAADTVRDETTRARFLREVAAPAQIGHDGIVEVYDAGFDPAVGSLFVAMEMLEGETLRALLSRGGVSLGRITHIVLELLPALAAAHAAGFVHRDLKPENVFLHRRRDGSERVKILDFGITRSLGEESSVTQSGVAMGTPHYMSPEQASSARDVTPASDVWAVGVILYEALAREPPFRGDTLASLVVDVLTRPHRPTQEAAPGVPGPIAAVVDRCLDKDASRRPRDGAALLSLFRGAAEASGLVRDEAGARGTPPTLDHPPRTSAARAGAPTMLAPADASGAAPLGRTTAPTAMLTPLPASVPGAHGTPSPAHGAAPQGPGMATPRGAPSWTAGGGSTVPATASIPSLGAQTPPPTMGGQTSPVPQASFPGAAPAPASPGPPRWLWPALAAGALAMLGLPALLVVTVAVVYSLGQETVRGSLAGGDLVLAGGQLYDSYDYEWRAGGRLQLHARSSAFETHIILHTPSGRQLDSSDGDGARIDMTLAESGVYRVIVTSRRAFQLGDYELDVDGP